MVVPTSPPSPTPYPSNHIYMGSTGLVALPPYLPLTRDHHPTRPAKSEPRLFNESWLLATSF